VVKSLKNAAMESKNSLMDFSEEQLTLFNNRKKLLVLRDLQGSYRRVNQVKERTKISSVTIDTTIRLGLEAGYVEHVRQGSYYAYKTTSLFTHDFELIKKLLNETE
jgi:hypothetical protein